MCLRPGGFYIGKISSESNLPGSIVVSLIGYFLACYYFLQVKLVPGGGSECCLVGMVCCALLCLCCFGWWLYEIWAINADCGMKPAV
jgi:hypothetical protein